MAAILLVDDEFDTISVLKLLLELEGYTVRVATNMRTALEIFEREGSDLVLTDYMMPGGSGVELALKLRSDGMGRHAGIILNSAGQEPIQEGPRPYDRFLQKPIEFADLLATLEAVLENHRGGP